MMGWTANRGSVTDFAFTNLGEGSNNVKPVL